MAAGAEGVALEEEGAAGDEAGVVVEALEDEAGRVAVLWIVEVKVAVETEFLVETLDGVTRLKVPAVEMHEAPLG